MTIHTTIYSKSIVCFARRFTNPPNQTDIEHICIKQAEQSGEYAILLQSVYGKYSLYRTDQFLVSALASMTLLMSELGIGSEWIAVKD